MKCKPDVIILIDGSLNLHRFNPAYFVKSLNIALLIDLCITFHIFQPSKFWKGNPIPLSLRDLNARGCGDCPGVHWKSGEHKLDWGFQEKPLHASLLELKLNLQHAILTSSWQLWRGYTQTSKLPCVTYMKLYHLQQLNCSVILAIFISEPITVSHLQQRWLIV